MASVFKKPNRLSLKKIYGMVSESAETKYKILYHIGPRPAKPVPPKHGNQWSRPWLKKPITLPCVFMSDNWKTVWNNHFIRGNVYAYKIPYAAIKEAGGLHIYDYAKEIIITKTIWDKYGLASRLYKSINKDKAEKIANVPESASLDRYLNTVSSLDFSGISKLQRSWMSLADLSESKQKDVIKFMKPQEIKEIIQSIEKYVAEAKFQPNSYFGVTKDYEKGFYARLEKEKFDTSIAKYNKLKSLLISSLER